MKLQKCQKIDEIPAIHMRNFDPSYTQTEKEKQLSVGFDTETTGFICQHGSDELVSIGLCRKNGDKFERYFLPEGPFSDEATKVTGIDYEKLKAMGAKPFSKEDVNDIMMPMISISLIHDTNDEDFSYTYTVKICPLTSILMQINT